MWMTLHGLPRSSEAVWRSALSRRRTSHAWRWALVTGVHHDTGRGSCGHDAGRALLHDHGRRRRHHLDMVHGRHHTYHLPGRDRAITCYIVEPCTCNVHVNVCIVKPQSSCQYVAD